MHDGYIYENEDGRIVSPVLLFAADLDLDADVTLFDSTLIDMHDGYMYESEDGRLHQSAIIGLL